MNAKHIPAKIGELDESRPESGLKSSTGSAATKAEPEHVPVVAAEEMTVPSRYLIPFEQAISEGKVIDIADGCSVRPLAAPIEASIVNLPRSSMLYVNIDEPRPTDRWLPVAHLQPSTLNGWAYLSAKRLYDPPSVPIFAELERLHGRGGNWLQGCDGEWDASARRMTGVEKVVADARVGLDQIGLGSPSLFEFIKYRGTWLPFRRVGKIAQRRVTVEPLTYKKISIV